MFFGWSWLVILVVRKPWLEVFSHTIAGSFILVVTGVMCAMYILSKTWSFFNPYELEELRCYHGYLKPMKWDGIIFRRASFLGNSIPEDSVEMGSISVTHRWWLFIPII